MTGSHIELFAGVGMTGIAAEAAGFKTIATAEVDPWCRSVLRKRHPDALHYEDVHAMSTLDDALRHASSRRPLLISGGFPCQDVSLVGRGAGIKGARSGLWTEFARVIKEFRPEYVLIENSPALRHRGLDVVLLDLYLLGYSARWDCIPAAAVGAPHLRDRIFIVAVPSNPSRTDGPAWASERFVASVNVPMKGWYSSSTYNSSARVTKFPRAGMMDNGAICELEPQAPIREAKQANLFHELFPTPVASDDGKSPEAHLAMKARLPGAPRRQITSLEVLARAGFPEDRGRSLSQSLFPTAEAAEAWRGKRFPTPTTADGSGGPGTTPKREGGKNLRTVVNESDGNGRLNPEWVEWMMGLPGGWTDPTLDNDHLYPHKGWASEHGIFRTVPAGAKDRGRRIKALGNGLVPQAAAVALKMIPELERAIR